MLPEPLAEDAPRRCPGWPYNPACSLRWWLTEVAYHLRIARGHGICDGTCCGPQWHIGQAREARRYVRELRRRHPGADPKTCRCWLYKLPTVNRHPLWCP